MKSISGVGRVILLGLVLFAAGQVVADDCLFDDRFEDNDVKAAATLLELPADEGLLISTYGDDDFYTFRLCAGGTLVVNCLFTDADGDIDISLESEDGTQLAIAASLTDNEQIVYTATTNEYIYLMVRMFEFNRCNGYQLQITLDCPPNEEICWDGIDNDGDGDADCADYGCRDMPPDYYGITYPAHGDVVTGTVVIRGSMDDRGKMTNAFAYTLAYGLAATPNMFPVDPMTPYYTNPVIKDVLGLWDTAGLGLPDDQYILEFIFVGNCYVWEQIIEVVVDNTPPLAEITSPVVCDALTGIVAVTGTAWDTNLASWVLDYADPSYAGWVTIASGTTGVNNGLLANWDTSSLPSCSTTLRLRVLDQRPGVAATEYLVPAKIGLSADLNNDKAVNLYDLAEFSGQYLSSW